MARVGYIRWWSNQDHQLQRNALVGARCERIYSDHTPDTTALKNLIETVHAGDTVIIWRLDKMAESLADLSVWLDRFDQMGVTVSTVHEGAEVDSLIRMLARCLAQIEQTTAPAEYAIDRTTLSS